MALSSIFARAAAGGFEISPDEQVLFTASEFQAAVAANELLANLGPDPVQRLEEAGVALDSLGAAEVAAQIFSTASTLRYMDMVDQLIGLMARRCLSALRYDRRVAVRTMVN